MAEVSLEEVYEEVEELKREFMELKKMLLSEEGELSVWAKERVENYLKGGEKRFISQKKIEEEFL